MSQNAGEKGRSFPLSSASWCSPYQPYPPFVPPRPPTRDIKARAISGGGEKVVGRGRRPGTRVEGVVGLSWIWLAVRRGLIQGSATPRRVSIHPSSGWPRGCASSWSADWLRSWSWRCLEMREGNLDGLWTDGNVRRGWDKRRSLVCLRRILDYWDFFWGGGGKEGGSRREREREEDSRRVLILFFCSFSLLGEIEGINWEK